MRDSLPLPSVCRNSTSFLFVMAFFNFLLPLFITLTSYRLMEQKLGRTGPPQVRPNPGAEDSALLRDSEQEGWQTQWGACVFHNQEQCSCRREGRERPPVGAGIRRHDPGAGPGHSRGCPTSSTRLWFFLLKAGRVGTKVHAF